MEASRAPGPWTQSNRLIARKAGDAARISQRPNFPQQISSCPVPIPFSRLLTLLFSVGLLGFIATAPATAQDRGSDEPRTSPNAAVSQTIGTTEVRLTYGRPQVNDRTIFGDLVPYGEVWRTGANEATTISVSSDVTVEGEPLPAGTYSLYTIPGPDSWTIIFNNTANQWGTQYDQSEDALRVDVDPESAPQHEMMTFVFEEVTDTSGTCVLYWADARVPFAIQVAEN